MKTFSLVVPCYKEEKRVVPHLENLQKQMEELWGDDFEIIAVNDGSPDNTKKVLKEAKKYIKNLIIVSYSKNAGKGNAVREGIKKSIGKYIGYMDADGEIPSNCLPIFWYFLEKNYDIVVGSKKHKDSEVSASFLRQMFSKGASLMNRFLFKIPVNDTQVGLKTFKREVAEQIFPLMETNGYTFDLEFLSLGKAFGYSMVEVPVKIDLGEDTEGVNAFGILIKFFQELPSLFGRISRSQWLIKYQPNTAIIDPYFFEMKAKTSNPMKLLFLSWRDIKNPEKGGAEVFTHEALKRMVANGHNIDHISPRSKGLAQFETIDGVNYYREGNIFSVILFAKKWLKNQKKPYDLVIDQSNTHQFFSPFWLPKNQKRAFFIHQLTREIWFKNMRFPFNLLGYIAEPFMLKLHRKSPTLTVSNSTSDDLQKLGFNASEVHILPEGIDFEPWVKDIFEEKQENFTVTYSGRFVKHKGIEEAIKSFGFLHAKYPETQMWLIGKVNKSYQTSLEKLAKKLKIHHALTFWGDVNQDKKLSLLSQSHTTVYTSPREGWGHSVIEAGAVGTTSVVYDSPGLRDSIQASKTALVTEKNNEKAMFQCLETLYKSPVLLKLLSENAHEWSQNFHWNHTGASMEKVISEIVGDKKKKS